MTAQIPDMLLLQDRKLSLAGINGQWLFNPADYNLQPMPRVTSCWRGYVCEYKVLSDNFLLDALKINLGKSLPNEGPHAFTAEAGPALNGIKPVPAATIHEIFNNTYHGLNLQIDFTGGILAASDFIQELYVHMGFHPAWKYKNVIELVISHGHVTETRDVSDAMQEIRNRMIKPGLEPDVHASREEIRKWIAETFRLDYNF